MKKHGKTICLFIGPLLFIACAEFLPCEYFTTSAARYSIGCMVWMAFWWITGPVDLQITGLLPIAINAIFSVTSMSTILAQYANEAFMLVLGAQIITNSWKETGVDHRIAIYLLKFAGSSLRGQVLFWFFLSTVMSAVLANVAVVAALIPVAYAMLDCIGEGDVENRKSAWFILMVIAWGASIGGLATPLGGATVLYATQYLEQVTGQEYMFVDWVIRFFPVMIPLVLSNALFIYFMVPKAEHLNGTEAFLESESKSRGKMTIQQHLSFWIFVLAVAFAFMRPLYEDLLPLLKPCYVYIIAAILTFLIKNNDGTPVMTWRKMQRDINWGVMYMIAGGYAVGKMLTDSEADQMLGIIFANTNFRGEFWLILALMAVTIILSDVLSNAAFAAIIIPIILTFTSALKLNPIPYIYIAEIGLNISYTLPTSVRAVPAGYGVPVKFMFRKGIILSLIEIILMTLVAYALLKFWPTFSTAS